MNASKTRITNFDDAFTTDKGAKPKSSATKPLSFESVPQDKSLDTSEFNRQPLQETAITEQGPSGQNHVKPEVISTNVKDRAASSDVVNEIMDNPTFKTSNTDLNCPKKNQPQSHPRPNAKKPWIKGRSAITSSKKTLLPGLLVAAIAFSIPAIFPSEQFATLLFEPAVLAKQPEFLQNNLSTMLNLGLYIIGGIALFLSVKAKNQGKLFIFDAYLSHKKSILKKPNKILLPQIVSVDMHWTPFSLLRNIGNLEVSSIKGEIIFKHCPNPDQVKALIEQKCREFKEV